MKRNSPGGDLQPRTLAEYKVALKAMTKERDEKQTNNEGLAEELSDKMDELGALKITLKEFDRRLDTANETAKTLAGKMAEADRGRVKAEEKLAEEREERARIWADVQAEREKNRTLERGLGANAELVKQARNILLNLAPLDGSGQ